MLCSDVTTCPWKEGQRERNSFQDMLFHGDIILVQVSLVIAVESSESTAKMVILEPLSEESGVKSPVSLQKVFIVVTGFS